MFQYTSGYILGYMPLSIGFGIFRLICYLPWTWLMAMGRALGRLSMLVTPERVRVTDINLRLCFPEMGAISRERLVRQHFEAMGMGLMDVGLAWWASDAKLKPLLTVHGIEHAQQALQQGRGVLFLTAHFTSIEMSGRVLCDLCPLHPVYRPFQNPHMEDLVIRQRMLHTAGVPIPNHNMFQILRVLRKGEGIWFAPDQNFAHNGGVFSPFFGIAASTNTATARFVRITNAAVVPFVMVRRTDAEGYDMLIEPALENFPGNSVQEDTDRINTVIEQLVKKYPLQYLWSHRRFKNRPPGEADLYQ
ncbi:hypothetical protein TI04_09565 [Achromatium sp. WMS2]|nr:hypothetical protein TI04_09565 [Achromatium sp. WMS2]